MQSASRLCLVFLSVLAASVLQSPSAQADTPLINAVAGPATHGATLTLSGSGFGDLALSEILLWENFDQGTNGIAVSGAPLLGSWTLNDAPAPRYSSTSAHRGLSSYCSSNSGGSHCQFVTAMPHDRTRFYGSYWYRYQYPAGGTGQTKLFQLWGNLPNPTLDYDPGVMSGGFSGGWFASYFVSDGGRTPGDQDNWAGGAPAMNVWHHFELILQQSGAGVANGSVLLKNDGAVIYERSNVATRAGADQFWNELLFFYGFTNFGAGQFVEHYVDDPYLAASWARVELGNASTFSASTQREIQIPSSWSPGSIQFTLNHGAFAAGTQVYLYIVNSDGLVNQNGYALTLAAGGDSNPPAPPSNLRTY